MQSAMDQVSQSCDNYMYDLTIGTKRQRLYTNQHLENCTMENYRRESALKVARRKIVKTPSKPL